jgi:hypothetical protein
MNARRLHIKNGFGYKMGDKHNSRVNNKGQEFIKFTKDNTNQVKQDHKATNHVSNVDANTSYMPYHAQPLKKQQKTIEEKKLEYARSAYMNARRLHIKNGFGYKMGDKHNSRVNNKGQKFIKFTKDNSNQVKQDNKATNHVSNFDVNASYMPYHAFDASYVLMKINMEKLLLYMLGHTTRGLRLVCGCPKCLYLA